MRGKNKKAGVEFLIGEYCLYADKYILINIILPKIKLLFNLYSPHNNIINKYHNNKNNQNKLDVQELLSYS